MHHYTHFKTYEDIHASLSKSDKKILQKSILIWNGKEIKLNETQLKKLPQTTQDEISILLEKSGYIKNG